MVSIPRGPVIVMLQSTKRNNNFLPQLRTSKIYSTRKQLNQRLRSESSLETCLIRNETAAGVIFFFICAIDCTGSLDITNSGVGLGFYSRPRLRNGQPYQSGEACSEAGRSDRRENGLQLHTNSGGENSGTVEQGSDICR